MTKKVVYIISDVNFSGTASHQVAIYFLISPNVFFLHYLEETKLTRYCIFIQGILVQKRVKFDKPS